MAIHDDNWTKEFKQADTLRMTRGERIFHGALGITLLSMLLSPWLPATVLNYMLNALVAVSVVAACFFTGYFFYKAITGRW
jgi:hypothetical protein